MGIFRIGVAVGRRHVHVSRHCRFRFQFKATGANFTALHAKAAGRVRRIGGQVVVLGQLIDRGRHHNRQIFRNILHARFILLAARRIERFAALGGARERFKGFTVAEVWGNPVVEQVVNPPAPGKCLIVNFRGGPVITVKGRRFCKVIAATHGEYPLIPFRLILRIEPGLLLTIEHGIREVHIDVRIAVLRIVHADRIGGTVVSINIIAHTKVIHPRQQRMVNGTGREFRLELCINRERVEVFI